MSSPLYSALRTLEIVEAHAQDMQRRIPQGDVHTSEFDVLLKDLRSAMTQVAEHDCNQPEERS